MANYENRPSLKSSGKDYSGEKVAIVVSEWNSEITGALYSGAYSTLIKLGFKKENIFKKMVPGSFELTIGSQWMAQDGNISAVIALGCVIQGETPHFDFICDAVAHGLTNIGLKYNKPIVFGVLTTNTHQQAVDRSGGKYGNKGEEAAEVVAKLLNF